MEERGKKEFSDNMKFEEKEMQAVWDLADRLSQQKKIDVDRNWDQLNRRIQRSNNSFRFFTYIKNAAAVLLLPLIVLSAYYYYQFSQLKSLPVRQLEVTTAYGVCTKVVLPDSSEVWLNSGSKLIYPERFTNEERKVSLEGEAYFKVTSDVNNRFDVQTSDGLTVSAYGTEFNVNAYVEEPVVKATLAEGNIRITQSHSSKSKDIVPGEQVVYSREAKDMEVRKVNLLVETGWKDGKMVFRRTPLDEIAQKLSRHFNVDIELRDPELYKYTYSATFTTETLVEILSLLERTAPIRCDIVEPEQQDDFAFTRKKIYIYHR